MTESIPHLNISTLPNGNLRLGNEDLNGNDSYNVDVHPIHVRLMAERLGLVPSSNVQAARRIETLCRRLRLLNRRINCLSDILLNHSDHEHADLDWETTYCAATRDISDEYVADLDDVSETPATAPATVTRDVAVTPSAGTQLELPA